RSRDLHYFVDLTFVPSMLTLLVVCFGHDGGCLERRKVISRVQLPIHSRQNTCANHFCPEDIERKIYTLHPLHEEVFAGRPRLRTNDKFLEPSSNFGKRAA